LKEKELKLEEVEACLTSGGAGEGDVTGRKRNSLCCQIHTRA
jgi:hypothetical protein